MNFYAFFSSVLRKQMPYKLILVMKLTIVLLLGILLQVSAKTSAQRISLVQENKPLLEIFKQISKQSGYDFVYNVKTVKNTAPITVNVKNQLLHEVLSECLANTSLTYEIINRTIVVKEKPIIAPITMLSLIDVRGRIVDKQNQPMIGVSVKAKMANKAVATDANGNFEIKGIDENDVLIISYLGYATKEVPVKNNLGNIILEEDVQTMRDVVVVGYGTQRRENLTGAVSQLTGDDLKQRPSSNIVNSLQGLLPGLNIQANNGNPGEVPDINIRGFNSINGGTPLVLIDGIQGNIDRINPLDVESISVLKDAASSAIYGARGAFGVILITTKKGKDGKVQVEYSNNFAATTPLTRTDYISDPYEYGRIVDAALNGYNGTNYTTFTSEDDWEKLRKVAAGELAPFKELQANGTYKFYDNTDWYGYLFRKWQPGQNHNISVSGGNDKIQGYVSGRAYKGATIQNMDNADLVKYNIRGKINLKTNDWLELSDNIQISTDKQTEFGGYKNGYGGPWSTTTWYFLFPFQPLKIDGVAYDNMGTGSQGALEDGYNYVRTYSEQIVNILSARVAPIKDLAINIDYSNTINHIANSTRLNPYNYLTTAKATPAVGGLNRLTETRNRNYYNALNIYGTYTKNFFNNKHHTKLLLGYNQEDANSDNILAEQGGLLVGNLSNLGLGTEVLRATGSGTKWGIQGYFGRFNYDFANKYLLEVNARYDGSSRFPIESRWGFFPSVSAGWYVSREKFFAPLEKAVSSLKLRASYGKLGNQNIDLYTFSQVLSTGQTTWLINNSRNNYVISPLPLPSKVSWENSRTINTGIDIGLLKGKLNASFDWYEKNVEGMYLPGEPLPAVFGAAEPKENIASLRNRGFEFSLGYSGSISVKGAPLTLRASASIYNFEGVITKYPNPNGLMSTFWEGQKLGTIYGYKIDGQFQSDAEAAAYQAKFTNPTTSLGQVYNYELNIVQNSQWKGLRAGDIKYVDVNGDGAINKGKNTLADHGDLVEIGNAMPRFPFGFNFSADWKAFDFSFAGAGVGSQDWYPTGNIFWGPYERPYLSFIRKDLVSNAWTPEQPNNTYPQISRGYASLGSLRSLGEVNDYYLTNVGYLRVKNLTFGYTIPQKITQKVKIQRLRFYFSGENLFTWRFGNLTKYVDPEMAGSGINYSSPGTATTRARLEDYPMGKTYSFGINVSL